VAITAAMPDGTGLKKFSERFPQRFFDVGIAEQHGMAFAAGLAADGFRPVTAIYSTFVQRAYDQVFHDICLQKLPVTVGRANFDSLRYDYYRDSTVAIEALKGEDPLLKERLWQRVWDIDRAEEP
jgi:hypothetical protein